MKQRFHSKTLVMAETGGNVANRAPWNLAELFVGLQAGRSTNRISFLKPIVN